MWLGDCACDILVMNVADFCLKNLPKDKGKRFRIISLTKEISN